MRTRGTILLACVFGGLAFGYVLGNIGFGDYAELNAMFTFQDLRMFLSFAGAVVIVAALFAVLRIRGTKEKIHAGVVPGAILFGAGWAISGGCPSIPIVQVATGYVPALITLVGVVVGMRLSRWANSRFFHVDTGSCGL
ncbi:hypothetical protein SRB5_67420 [Streptomyces sp. RB5]|uniref:Sulphur transport domain-containing protein n=1 Tax=Streptomyces smaragdinus TaxID=2585196 RepID=A0A7K0CT56_9ACTN|nr:YeeE/YedE thiosulfate transporter family protein [Streptomyces smaragdinus]MQY16543.1 hypothetical protein [Streptomyces smaragdinus]